MRQQRHWIGALAVALSLSSGTAMATGFNDWQGWGGSANTANLTLVEGPADYDSDGDLDIALYKPSNGKVWVGKLTATNFQFCAASADACVASNTEAWATITPSGCGLPHQFHSADLTGDSKPDIAVYNQCDGTIKTLTNTGTSFTLTGTQKTVAPAAGWTMLASNFVTSDAKADLMVFYSGDGSVYVSTNFSGALGPWVERDGPGAGAWEPKIGDFNGDSVPDLFGSLGAFGKVGMNTGSNFTWTNWYEDFSGGSCQKHVVGFFSGNTTSDVGILSCGTGDDAGKLLLDLFRNSGGALFHHSVWTKLDPATGWSLMAGNYVASAAGQPVGVQDLFGYHSTTGSFWLARNNGMPPEGYVWPLSGAPGDLLEFSISGALDNNLTYNVEIRRLETNALGDVVLVTPLGSQHDKKVSAVFRVIDGAGETWRRGPQWPVNLQITIPTEWTSGYYVATLRGLLVQGEYRDGQIVFAVNPASNQRKSTAMIANVNTWNAYNKWGDRNGSKYEGRLRTTFLRPNPKTCIPVQNVYCSFPISPHLAYAETLLLGKLVDLIQAQDPNEGIDIYTDIDFHNEDGFDETTYDRWIIGVHPEYWTTQMYDKMKDILDAGKDLLYLGGNGVFEIVEYEDLDTTATFFGGEDNTDRWDLWFRRKNVGTDEFRPERALLGIATVACPLGAPQPYVIDTRPAPGDKRVLYDAVLASTSLAEIDTVGTRGYLCRAAAGHEVDVMDDLTTPPCGIGPKVTEPDNNTPTTIVRIARPPAGKVGADMTIYRSSTNGVVFSVGSIDFGQSLVIDTKLQTIVSNVIHNL